MANYIPGTYESAARGYRGKLVVNVTVTEDKISDIQIVKHKEVRGLAWDLPTSPIEVIPPQIIEFQSLNIPLVNGADLTSQAILDAVASALKEAGATDEDIEALKNVPYPLVKEAKDEILNVDIAVFGAGAGGLAAAIEAKEAGKNVVLIEKQGITGGSTARSGGKRLGCGTKWQKKQGIHDTVEDCYDYLMEVGNRRGDFMNHSKNRYLVDNLNDTLDCYVVWGTKFRTLKQYTFHFSLGVFTTAWAVVDRQMVRVEK